LPNLFPEQHPKEPPPTAAGIWISGTRGGPGGTMKNLVPFSENLWGDRWGKGKEESGTSAYIRTAHMFVGQPRGPEARPRSYFRSPGPPSRWIAHSPPLRLDLL
jgi:hypothetical protein